MERGRWEGQNFQLESSAPGRRRSRALKNPSENETQEWRHMLHR